MLQCVHRNMQDWLWTENQFHISMVSGLMPVVGIPLPLVSYGGSAMLAIIISLGLVLNAELNGNLKKISNA